MNVLLNLFPNGLLSNGLLNCRVLSCGLLVAWLAATPWGYGDEYEVDTAHSSVVFRIKHSDLNHIYGLFSDIQGTFSADESGGFDVSVGVDSINTGNESRDRHLKSPDFFSARQYPRIQFTSTSVKLVDDSTLEVDGEITLHGVTQPAKAKITTATGTGRRGEARAGMEATMQVKRSDFNLGGPGGLSDEVTVVISLQGAKQ